MLNNDKVLVIKIWYKLQFIIQKTNTMLPVQRSDINNLNQKEDDKHFITV